MALFDGILPQGGVANPMQGLLDTTKLPVTAGMVQKLMPQMQAPPPEAPAAGDAPQSPQMQRASGIADRAARGAGMPGSEAPYPSPYEAASAAAARGALSGRDFDSPWASLADSAFRAIAAGVPAFRAQKQANREAEYMAEIQANRQADMQGFLSNPDNFTGFGASGIRLRQGLQAMSAMGDYEGASKLLQESELWKPPQTAIVGGDGLYDVSNGRWLRSPTTQLDPFKPMVMQGPDGQPLKNEDGTPMTVLPAGPGILGWKDLDQSGQLLAGGLGYKYGDEISPEDSKFIYDQIQNDKLRAAQAGRAVTNNVQEDPFAKSIRDALMSGATSGVSTAQAALRARDNYAEAYRLIDSGDIKTGPFSNMLAMINKTFNPNSQASRDQYMAAIVSAIAPSLKPLLGGAFSKTEFEMLMKASGGDLGQARNALLQILRGRMREQEALVSGHNNTYVKPLMESRPDKAADLKSFWVDMQPYNTDYRDGQTEASSDSPTGYIRWDAKQQGWFSAAPPAGGAPAQRPAPTRNPATINGGNMFNLPGFGGR